MTGRHGFGGLPCERTCRGVVMAESSSAWRRLLREKQAVTKRVPMWRPTLLAFTNGVVIHVICRRLPRAGTFQCKGRWYEIRSNLLTQERRCRRPCYASNALSFFVAVGNLPRPAFITSSASVKYRSPKVPVILECKPVASRPA